MQIKVFFQYKAKYTTSGSILFYVTIKLQFREISFIGTYYVLWEFFIWLFADSSNHSHGIPTLIFCLDRQKIDNKVILWGFLFAIW